MQSEQAWKIVFATNNQHKVDEVSALLGPSFQLLGLRDIGLSGDIPETGLTLQENAAQKAWFVHEKTSLDCFSDDTGLEVEALNGQPGVFSARYAGEGCSFSDNILKLLSAMDGVTNRRARFRTVICLIVSGKEYYFQGEVEGRILESVKGRGGFGYDPIFQPCGFDLSFSEMEPSQKNAISHRGKAISHMLDFLNGSIRTDDSDRNMSFS